MEINRQYRQNRQKPEVDGRDPSSEDRQRTVRRSLSPGGFFLTVALDQRMDRQRIASPSEVSPEVLTLLTILTVKFPNFYNVVSDTVDDPRIVETAMRNPVLAWHEASIVLNVAFAAVESRTLIKEWGSGLDKTRFKGVK